jgi:twitching motility protein PilT
MRDLETIFLAIEAASTGHLVFGTLHTQNASKTVDRIIDIFPANQQAQIRATLSDTLKAVVAQTLFKRIDVKGRCAALEILIVTPAVSNLIREGKTFQLPGVIQTGKKYGMITLEDSIMDLLKKRWISPEEAYDKAVDKAKFLPFLSKPPDDLGLA